MAEHHHTLDRAAARLPDTDDEVPYLGSAEDVEGILRGFIIQVHERWLDFDGQEATRAAKVAADEAEAERLGRAFLGEMPEEFRPVGSWNSEGEVAAFCAKWSGIAETEPRVIMAVVFKLLVARVYEALLLIESGGTPEDAAVMVEGMLEDTRNLLLGILPVDGGMDVEEGE